MAKNTEGAAIEHCDSDEDCEIYFLKPVNEYNINERIKAANKELFDGTTGALDDDDDGDGDVSLVGGGNRKVTFALNLEDYEGENGAVAAAGTPEHLPYKLQRKDFQFPAIDEETLSVSQTLSGDDDVEEICEEILVMDMEGGSGEHDERTAAPATVSATPTQRRQIVKQDTFAYDDDSLPEQEIEEVDESDAAEEPLADGDNKSLTNLLLNGSDGENETHASSSSAAVNGGGNALADIDHDEPSPEQQEEEEEEEEEDDRLSIIVASYISSDEETPLSPNGEPQSPAQRIKVAKSRRILPFHKRFTLRRRRNGNSIGAAAVSSAAQLTDLKLSYKTCCEYRTGGPEKLPKYTGYLSEYGLSREQLETRAAQAERRQRGLLDQTLRASEQELRKMQDNERAFTTWLRQKMRHSISKTRNMFDVKSEQKRCGGSATAGVAGRTRTK